MSNHLPVSTDPLGEALHFLRISGTFYCRSEFRAPWALDLPPFENCLMLHVVTAGRCILYLKDGEPVQLTQGSVAMVTHGKGHVLASRRGVARTRLFDAERELLSPRYEVLRLGQDGEPTSMLCGVFEMDDAVAEQLTMMLPEVVVVDSWTAAQSDWLYSILRMITAEAREMSAGGETVITRLADILVVQVIRHWLSQYEPGHAGWLKGLKDRALGPVIAQIHRLPLEHWTLERLAKTAGMSRSSFAARFTELVGEPAMRYATRWKMNAAHQLLKSGEHTAVEVALLCGYESEAAFHRAFKKWQGTSPGAARREASSGDRKRSAA